MSENFPIEIRDTENSLLARYDAPTLCNPSDLVVIMNEFKFRQKIEVGLQITQWMPDRKGYFTIGEGY